MLIHRRLLLVCMILVSGSVFVLIGKAKGQTGTAPSAAIKLEPCEVPGASPGAKEKVLCANHQVFENRLLRSGRKINIKIVVFPALSENKSADPYFYVPGGPGSSATADAPYIVQGNPQIRQNRDMVFVDQRGTGGSNHLDCVYFNPSDPQSFFWLLLSA